MSDVTDFELELRRMLTASQSDLDSIGRVYDNLLEVHKQINTLEGMFDLIERDKEKFVRKFQERAALQQSHERPFGHYNLDDPNDPLPQIMQRRDQMRQEYVEQGYYQPGYTNGYEAAE